MHIFYPNLGWKRDKAPAQTQKVTHAVRRALDEELNRAEGDGQPEFKDSTERMQDMAEDPVDSDKAIETQHMVGSAPPFPISNFPSMFETWSGEGMILSQEAQEGRPKFQCSLCRAGDDRYKGVPSFYRLNQLNEHVKSEHDIIMYSTSVYTKQKDVSSKHLTSGLISRIIDPDGKGRKTSRNGKDPADPFLEVRRMELAMDEPTAEPPPLTGEKVDGGLLVRPGILSPQRLWRHWRDPEIYIIRVTP